MFGGLELHRHFGNSYQELVSFFAKDRNPTLSELEENRASLAEEIVAIIIVMTAVAIWLGLGPVGGSAT